MIHSRRRRLLMSLNRLATPIMANQTLMRPFGITLCQVRYVGRRSGREVTLTAWWRSSAGGGRIDVGLPQYKTWWRNFRGGAPIEVTVDGVSRTGAARTVESPNGKVHVDVVFDG